MRFIWCAVFFGALELGAGAKILTLVPTPARSHHNLLERFALKLAENGHEVTFVTTYKQPKPVPNLKEIILPDLYKELAKIIQPDQKGEESNMFEMRHMPKWALVTFFPSTGPLFMDMVLSSEKMQTLLRSDEKFDLILGEIFLGESLLAGLSYKFKAPIIGLAAFMPNLWANYMVGNPAPLSYVPNSFMGYYNRMTFFERVENVLYSALEEVNYRFVLKEHDKVMRKYFGNDLPPIENIIKNTSFVLVNHHYSLAFPRPYLPNMVEIGGYHVNPPKPLPADLKKYFDESKHGVILFSMGSHLKSAQFSPEKKKAILEAFSKLKQDVLWKFEDDTLTDLPKNVKISKWLPQSDILAHPNLKLFITHGGLLSTTEAVTRGVPIVGIPVMGDQPLNMRYNKAAGFGLAVDFDDLNEETLYNAVTEVLNNPKYKENAQRGSKLIQDTPLPTLDTAMYWIEYVLRHKGAPHLRSAAQDLAWYELYLLDVLGTILIASTLSILVIFYVFKFIIKGISALCCKKSKKMSSNKKKN